MSFDFKNKLLQEVLEDPTRRNIVRELALKNKETFIILYRDVLHLKKTTARHHLKFLVDNNVIQRIKVSGSRTNLLQINPLVIHDVRTFLQINKPYLFIGMLGKEKFSLEIESSFHALEKQNIHVEKMVFFCGKINQNEIDTDQELKQLVSKSNTEIIFTELYNIEKVLKDMNQFILRIIFDYQIIANVTRGTKIHSIALYQLARDYGFSRYYVPEGTNQLLKLH